MARGSRRSSRTRLLRGCIDPVQAKGVFIERTFCFSGGKTGGVDGDILCGRRCLGFVGIILWAPRWVRQGLCGHFAGFFPFCLGVFALLSLFFVFSATGRVSTSHQGQGAMAPSQRVRWQGS